MGRITRGSQGPDMEGLWGDFGFLLIFVVILFSVAAFIDFWLVEKAQFTPEKPAAAETKSE